MTATVVCHCPTCGKGIRIPATLDGATVTLDPSPLEYHLKSHMPPKGGGYPQPRCLAA